MGNHVSQQDHRHKLAGIRQCHITGSEEQQDGIQKQQTDHHKRETDDQVQGNGVTQQMLCCLVVFLA